jgi:hypothetical protein
VAGQRNAFLREVDDIDRSISIIFNPLNSNDKSNILMFDCDIFHQNVNISIIQDMVDFIEKSMDVLLIANVHGHCRFERFSMALRDTFIAPCIGGVILQV